MTLPDPPSLSSDERDLAQRLARIGPHGEPSPALDARILAAAHAATVASSAMPMRSPRRWPMALGLAASLVLTVGIAWRLRPLPETLQVHQSEAIGAPRAVAQSGPAAVEPAADDSLESAPANASAMDSVAAVKPQAIATAPRSDERSGRSTVADPPAPAAARASAAVLDEPAPPSAPVAAKATDLGLPTVAPMTPSAGGAPQAFGKVTAAPSATSDAAGSAQRQATAADSSQAGMTQAAAGAAATRADEPLDDIPPATADSPAVRVAWLQRIHALIDSGDGERARASLREFVRRYPAYPLPEDLRALER